MYNVFGCSVGGQFRKNTDGTVTMELLRKHFVTLERIVQFHTLKNRKDLKGNVLNFKLVDNYGK